MHGGQPSRHVVEDFQALSVPLRLLVQARVAEKEPDLLADAIEPAKLTLGEAAPGGPPHHVEAADHLVVDDERQE